MLLPNWHTFSLHPQLSRALYAQQFLSPTPIQRETLPLAFRGRDIVGVAETGSGKTLAYGLPILHQVLTHTASTTSQNGTSKRRLRALILAPTRELALQVSAHLNACLNRVVDEVTTQGDGHETAQASTTAKKGQPPGNHRKQGKGKGKGKEVAGATQQPKGPPLVSVAAIVGGMSAQKQRRVLSRGVDVLVATPGRLWDIIQEDDDLAEQIGQLRFLVLDEADRMVETGHFAEMENILRLTLRQVKEDEIEPEPERCEDSKEGVKGGLQTFLDFRDPSPAVIDLSPEGGVVATLQESKVDCLSTDKDAYLYYFLLRYPGRTLVFLSSIDGIRRLTPLMDLLGVPAFPLHSQLEQRQRLKNLDRFKSTPHAVLLATDVAARGLDVPAVDHVVHYQAPRTADAYVHRNGRTARASRRGFSLLLCAPDEQRLFRALMGRLGRQEDAVPEMPVELYMLDKLKVRIQLARQIDTAQHRVRKQAHERNWLKEAAEAMEIELDPDLARQARSRLDSEGEREAPSKQKRKAAEAKAASLKAELKRLLAQPLVARGVSTRYITSGSTLIADDMLTGEYHETMVGLKIRGAGSDLVPARKRKVEQKEEEFEEWNGIAD
ncbi:DEAD-domain-containing protein [Amylocystis lapponica]|nr:DEAD-domain-containing protein [Amylocystis lapponica]